MGFFRRRDAAKSIPPRTDYPLTGFFTVRADDGDYAAPTTAELEASYTASSIVRACVDEITQGFRASMIKAPMGTLILLEAPNETEDTEQFFARLLSAYLTTGQTFIYKRRQGGAVDTLHAFAPTRVTIRQSRNPFSPIARFELRSQHNVRIIAPPRDVIWIRDPSIADPAAAAPKLAAAWPEIGLDIQRTTYQRDTLANLVSASLVAETEGQITLEQRKALQDSFRAGAGGSRRGGVLVLPSGFKMSAPGVLKDIDMPGMASLCESRIAAVLNVPPILVGLRAGLERSTYANYAEARSSFYKETIGPLALMFASALTRGLITNEGAVGEITITPPADPIPTPAPQAKHEEARIADPQAN